MSEDEQRDERAAEDERREEEGRRLFEEHRERVARLLASMPAPRDEQVVFDASEPGVKLIDVIEATKNIPSGEYGELVRPDMAHLSYVRLPHGYATVEFLRMLFAVSG